MLKNAPRQRPLIQKIAAKIRRDNEPYREIIINSEPLEKRVAVLNNGILETFDLERAGDDRLVGAIFTAVSKISSPASKPALSISVCPRMPFSTTGTSFRPRPIAGQLHRVCARHPPPPPPSDDQRKKREKITLKDIPNLYPIGFGNPPPDHQGHDWLQKGRAPPPTSPCPDAFLVLMPYGGQCGISRKIEDDKGAQAPQGHPPQALHSRGAWA